MALRTPASVQLRYLLISRNVAFAPEAASGQVSAIAAMRTDFLCPCSAALSLRDRSLVTVVALMAQGITDSSIRFHLMSAKKNGITKEEIAEIVTHAAFYCGWPKAWAVFRIAKEIWND